MGAGDVDDLAALHPVAKLLWRRHAERSVPGARKDGQRIGLAVEGGAVRGVVSGGMLLALGELGLRDTFDVVYGASAGAFNAAYFLAGQAGRALPLYYDEMLSGRFFDLRRLLRGQPVLDVEWVVDEVLGEIVPLDWSALLASPIALHVVASSVVSGRPVCLTDLRSADEVRSALLASSRIPFLAGPPVVFRGDRLLDAAVLLSHPFVVARDDGCTHVLSLSTRPRGRVRPGPGAWDRLTAWRLDRLRRGLGAASLRRVREYGQVQRELAALSGDVDRRPSVLDVAPREGSTAVGNLERDPGRIMSGARTGYEAAYLALTGRRVDASARLGAPPTERRPM